MPTPSVSSASGPGQLDSLSTSGYNLTTLIYPSIGIGTEIPSSVTFNINLPQSSKYFISGGASGPGNSAAQQNFDLLARQGLKNKSTNGGVVAGAATLGVISGARQGSFNAGVASFASAAILAAPVGVLSESITLQPKLKRIDTSITLFCPDTIMSQNDNDYDTVSVTAALGDLGTATAIGSSIFGAGEDFISTIGHNMIGKQKIGFNNAQAAEASGILGQASGLVGEGFKDLTLKSAGRALNPQIELMFRGVKNRQFIFAFDFYPRSKAEANTIYQICQTFKKYSAPELANNSNARYWIPPGSYDITYNFKGSQNPYIGKISTCVCTMAQINYAGSGAWATFDDGSPIHVNLQLTFVEVDIMSRELIETGY